MLETEVRVERATPYRPWAAACAAAETVGVRPRPSRARYPATVLVVGWGWAAASAPSVVGGGDAEQPPVLLGALGGAALGPVLGSVLGAAQAWTLRGAVRHPRRSVVADAVAWPGFEAAHPERGRTAGG